MNDSPVDCQSRDVTEPQRDREGETRSVGGVGGGSGTEPHDPQITPTPSVYHSRIARISLRRSQRNITAHRAIPLAAGEYYADAAVSTRIINASTSLTVTFVAFQPTVALWLRGSDDPALPSCLTICSRPPSARDVVP